VLREVRLRNHDVVEQLASIALTLAQLADDAQPDRRGQQAEQFRSTLERLPDLNFCIINHLYAYMLYDEYISRIPTSHQGLPDPRIRAQRNL
jgi:hypothetical protein